MRELIFFDVLTVVNDRKQPQDTDPDGSADFYLPTIISATDYYAFGFEMLGRKGYYPSVITEIEIPINSIEVNEFLYDNSKQSLHKEFQHLIRSYEKNKIKSIGKFVFEFLQIYQVTW